MTHKNLCFFEKSWLIKIMVFYAESWLIKNHGFLWEIMTHEKSSIFMENQYCLYDFSVFLGRLFGPKAWLFRTIFATCLGHFGIILGPSRDNSKVILRSFWRLLGHFLDENFSGPRIDLGWSAHLAEAVSCRSRLEKKDRAIYEKIPQLKEKDRSICEEGLFHL